jgi:Fe-S-cluster containining protein
MAADDLNKIKEGIPFSSPVQPVELALDDEIQFHCHRGVACFNACCKNIDIQITPYDILRLKRRLGMNSSEFVARYTTPFAMDFHNMPGLKLNAKPGTSECVFLTEEGCGVYQDRPAACRYYALGSMGVRKKDSANVEDIFFLVKEDHCLGHAEPRTLTVRQYREEQGCDEYDEHNRAWRDVILKKRSSGPTVGAPSERSLQLFDMCSYDMDSFRKFIQTDGFGEVFDLDDQSRKNLLENEEQLLQFAFRFLKQVLFGEMSIPVKEDAKDKRMARRRESQARIQADQGSNGLESGTSD